MAAQKIHLRRQEGIGNFSFGKPYPESRGSMGDGRQKPASGREETQLVKPVAQVQSELRQGVSAIGHCPGGTGPEVMAISHGW